jgi:hypothetical protein
MMGISKSWFVNFALISPDTTEARGHANGGKVKTREEMSSELEGGMTLMYFDQRTSPCKPFIN